MRSGASIGVPYGFSIEQYAYVQALLNRLVQVEGRIANLEKQITSSQPVTVEENLRKELKTIGVALKIATDGGLYLVDSAGAYWQIKVSTLGVISTTSVSDPIP